MERYVNDLDKCSGGTLFLMKPTEEKWGAGMKNGDFKRQHYPGTTIAEARSWAQSSKKEDRPNGETEAWLALRCQCGSDPRLSHESEADLFCNLIQFYALVLNKQSDK
ncbi:hypothetical protein chiPu_0005503 [Chiloscyllium punctatum]|uniref:Uncharacterized protein n=1 Tax=Chiloscyllium punctatum TaxID=137246 RepID=A0A401S9K8_CHIPU|nr:hypothetical protein [Chiloscyllium punctatum]